MIGESDIYSNIAIHLKKRGYKIPERPSIEYLRGIWSSYAPFVIHKSHWRELIIASKQIEGIVAAIVKHAAQNSALKLYFDIKSDNYVQFWGSILNSLSFGTFQKILDRTEKDWELLKTYPVEEDDSASKSILTCLIGNHSVAASKVKMTNIKSNFSTTDIIKKYIQKKTWVESLHFERYIAAKYEDKEAKVNMCEEIEGEKVIVYSCDCVSAKIDILFYASTDIKNIEDGEILPRELENSMGNLVGLYKAEYAFEMLKLQDSKKFYIPLEDFADQHTGKIWKKTFSISSELSFMLENRAEKLRFFNKKNKKAGSILRNKRSRGDLKDIEEEFERKDDKTKHKTENKKEEEKKIAIVSNKSDKIQPIGELQFENEAEIEEYMQVHKKLQGKWFDDVIEENRAKNWYGKPEEKLVEKEKSSVDEISETNADESSVIIVVSDGDDIFLEENEEERGFVKK